MINRDNYESYLFLYQEGELDNTTRTEVERFLLQNPDIREEMDTYYDPNLVVTVRQPVTTKHASLSLWHWVAAACVLTVVGIGVYFTRQGQTEYPTLVAENHSAVPFSEVSNATNASLAVEPVAESVPLVRVQTPCTLPPLRERVPTAAPTEPVFVPTQVAPVSKSTPVPPIVVASASLAQVNEIVEVDNLARIVPDAKEAGPRPTFQLARAIKRGLDNSRHDIVNFVYSIFSTNSEGNDMAIANQPEY